MRHRRLATILVLLMTIMGIAPRALAQSSPPADSTVIDGQGAIELLKSLYGRIALYIKAGQAFKSQQNDEPYRLENEVRIEVHDVSTGPIEDILDRPYAIFVDRPSGHALHVTTTGRRFEDDPPHALYDAKWNLHDYRGSMAEDWDGSSVRDVMLFLGDAVRDVDRYISYRVVVTMDGQSRTYRAMALHHTERGRQKYDFIDTIIGSPVLKTAFNEMRPPVRAEWLVYSQSDAYREFVDAFRLSRALGEDAAATVAWPGEWADVVAHSMRGAETSVAANLAGTGIRAHAAEVFPYCDSDTSICDPLSCDYPACAGSLPTRRSHWSIQPDVLVEEPPVYAGCADETRWAPLGAKRDKRAYHYHSPLPAWGYHQTASELKGVCTYSNYNSSGCAVLCQVAPLSWTAEDAGLPSSWGHGFTSASEFRDASGWATQLPSCSTTLGTAWGQCPFGFCFVSITIKGFTVTGDGFWTYDHSHTHSCNPPSGTPIVVDVAGTGFALTNFADGVTFDLNADGTPERLSWTAAGADDAFLVLDRNGNGSIDDGRELFGNFTSQPSSAAPNGFIALSVFDTSDNGGDGNGEIDRHDAVFERLRLWRDANHNGTSEAGEMATLAEAGVSAIDLDYKESKKTDEYGNSFKYRTKLRLVHDSSAARWAWDVFLLSQ